MFGMEKDKDKKKALPFLFDLEKELDDNEKRRVYAQRIEKRIVAIKEKLHSGSKKEFFDKLGVLLNGYHALVVVLARACKK
jgi:hypothetical protein